MTDDEKIAAHLCKAAYLNTIDKVYDYIKHNGVIYHPHIDFVQKYQVDNVRAYVISTKSKVWIAFAGTNDIRDVIEDLDARKTKNKYCIKVHKGFYTAYRKICHSLLLEALVFDLPVYVVGHSMGGALANLLHLESFFCTKLITFNSPRVVADNNVMIRFDNCDCEVTRYTYNNDPVNHMPSKLRGFRHIKGTHKHIVNGSIKINPKLHNFFTYFKEWFNHRSWQDHGIDNFLL